MVEGTPQSSATFPVTFPVTFNEGHLEVDGFRIRYQEAGQGDTVVMLDGITWGLTGLHQALARSYRVVAIEVPGFGNSPANTLSQSVKDLANTVAQAASRVGLEKYTLIGTSFSANVALWQTLLSPESVEALVLISPTSIQPIGDPTAGPAGQIAGQLFAHPENARSLPSPDPAVSAREHALVQRLQGLTHDAELESRIGEIECPTQVVFGLKDRMVSSQAGSIYREKIPNSNFSIVYDAGHIILADRPEALIDLVVDYVERRDTFVVGHHSSLINP